MIRQRRAFSLGVFTGLVALVKKLGDNTIEQLPLLGGNDIKITDKIAMKRYHLPSVEKPLESLLRSLFYTGL